MKFGLNKSGKQRKSRGTSMRTKLVYSLGTIAAILLLSGVISILEYRRMSDYVSDKISANIKSVNLSSELSDITQDYNAQMQAMVLRNDILHMPEFDPHAFTALSDSLRSSITSKNVLPIVDNVEASFNDFMTTSLKFDEVFFADSIDTREWFFGILQPRYSKFRSDMNTLNEYIHHDLYENSSNFDAGFYRSIIPGVVSVCAGLLLIVLLFYFIMSNYVNPICRMSDELKQYKTYGHRYTYDFEGDDQLSELNSGVSEIIEENIEFKRRLKNFREEMNAE